MSRYWYAYQGGSETSPLSYTRSTFNPQDICVGGTVSCTIYSPPNNADPTKPSALSTRLQQYLIAAEGLQSEFPVFPNKAYVYTKL